MWLTARIRTGSRRSRIVAGRLAALCLSVVVGACSSPVFAPGGSSPPSSSDAPRPRDRVHQQAQDALVRWADAVRASGGASITFVGELTSQIGDWELDVGDNNKVALLSGNVEWITQLPEDAPGRKEVRWLDDDTKIDVNVLSAPATLDELVAGRTDCGGCEPLQVTEAKLATGLVDTSRGTAEVPMWVFGVAGSAVRITRVAVDESVTVVPPPWNADDPPVGLSIEWARGASDSRDLEVGFVGAPEDGSQPCGADYTAEAVESELAVVVIVEEHQNPTPGACALVGAVRTADVRLESRLGDRVVLEVLQGLPVAVEAPD